MSIVNRWPSCYFVPRTSASYGYRCEFRGLERDWCGKFEGETKGQLTFLSDCDTFVVLPTGYNGKLLIYVMLLLVFGHR